MAGMPTTYAEWKRCIEVDCGIELTTDFCERRIRALADPTDAHTASFRRTWGDDHLARVANWFQLALETDAAATG